MIFFHEGITRKEEGGGENTILFMMTSIGNDKKEKGLTTHV